MVFSNSNDPLENGPEKNHSLEQIANLGSMIDELKIAMPLLLSESLSPSLLSNDILLRMCPTLFDEFNYYLPKIKGHTSYFATFKTIQWILSSFVLNPRVMIHIHSIRTSSEPDPQAVYPNSTKIYVRWKTCSADCHHLSKHKPEPGGTGSNPSSIQSFHSTSDAKLGTHRWSQHAGPNIFLFDNAAASGKSSSSFHAIPQTVLYLTKALAGLKRDDRKIERVISGIFIFELNLSHTEIVAHTIENIDWLERGDSESVTGGLRVC